MSTKILTFALFAALAAGCSGAPTPTTTEPVPGEAEEEAVRLDPPIPMTVAEVESGCKEHLDEAKRIRDAMVAAEGERDKETVLAPINDLIIEVDAVLPIAELVANTHPEKEVRDAAEKCQQDAMKFISEFELDREVYEVLAAVQLESLDATARRFAEHLLRDYRRAGVDKEEAERKELSALKEEMVKTGQEFARRIREGKLSIQVTAKELKGLPEDFVKAHEPDEGGKITITTDYPDFIPVVSYADDEKVRKAIYFEFLKRAYPENEATFAKLLELRHTYATKLGYEDWAAYNSEDKMVKEKKVIAEFIDKVADIARPRMKKDLKEILKRKKKDVRKAKQVKVWDRFYYVNKIKKEKYDVDAQVVRAYFDYPAVKEGLFTVMQGLFGVSFERVPDARVIHESVEAYNITDGGEILGRFYLDMHPREGKYGHAAEFPMITGIKGRQIPSASLVCNFPAPSDKGPALMEHGEVTTFFHEFGHLMHQLLAGRQDWVTLSGINCEWDFVEAPSQLMEEWAWDHDVLKLFAVHHETGEVIPKDLVEKMKAADEFGKGVHVMRQMFYAALSYNYHATDPKGLEPLDMVKKMQKSYSPYPYEEGTYVFANFGHLEGYSSMYYTYMWSLVMAKDMMTRFKSVGLMDKGIASSYRLNVIEPGGTVDAAIMVRNFLNREYAFDAFQEWLEKE